MLTSSFFISWIERIKENNNIIEKDVIEYNVMFIIKV